MKKLLFICGPNGVGKTTVCRRLNERLHRSAWVDSDWCRCINPFSADPEALSLIERNITCLLANYLNSDLVDYVIFSYGLHGFRAGVFERVKKTIDAYPHVFVAAVLTCDEVENVRRMRLDGRDEARIQRAVDRSGDCYRDIPFAAIDTTDMSVDEVVERVMALASEDRFAVK